MHQTIEEAEAALHEASQDVIDDMGESGLDQGWRDIVRTIGDNCDEGVKEELYRRHL
jgi:hypothetical protein